MKNIIPAIALFITGAAFIGCKKTDGKGPVVSRNVEISSNYNEIELSGVGDVEVISNNSDYVEVRTHENLFEILEIKVSDNKLHIGLKKNQSIGKYTELLFVVNTTRLITEAEVNGSGRMTLETATISTSKFKGDISGSGQLTALGISASEVEGDIAGSGNIRFSGVTGKADFEISGSGNTYAFDLVSANTEVSISGSGNVETSTTSNLDVEIAGSGNVKYKGTPVITSAITGSGKVINAN